MTTPQVADTPDPTTNPDEEQEHTGGMVALIPTDGMTQQLTVDGGEDPSQLHLTLAYLGDDVTDWDDEQRQAVLDTAQHAAIDFGDENGLMHARVMGHAQFNPDGGPAGDLDPCAVYLVGDSDQIPMLAAQFEGHTTVPQHTPYIPHITAGYGLDPAAMSYTGPVAFDRIRVAFGDDTTDIPLGGDPTVTAAAPTTDAPVIVSDTGTEIRVHWDALAVEGLDTGDGRYLTPGGGSTRTPPLSLLALPYANHGGADAPAAEVFGEITQFTRRPGPEVISKRTGEPFPEGTFVWGADATIDGTHKFATMVRKGHLRGGSVDLSDLDAEIIDDDAAAMSDNPRRRAILTRYEIAAATMVPVPAFADAYCDIVSDTAGDDAVVDAVAASGLPVDLDRTPVPMWRSTELDDPPVVVAAVTAKQRDTAKKKGDTFPGTDKYPITTRDQASKAVGLAGNSDLPSTKVRKWLMGQLKKKGWADLIPDTWNPDGTLTASGATPVPPIDWFRDPQLDAPTIPPVVTDDGRIYGHVAAWASTHIGYVGRRVNPPRSQTDYSHFHVGAARVISDSGEPVMIPAGHIALDTGHAAMTADYLAATAHYDNTGSLVADVCAGEDAHGIWVAGAVVPGVDEVKLHKLRTCGLSGDWRRIGAGLEMVAAISVPTPGFPVPRARVASGVPVAMVAAGALVPDLTHTGPVDYEHLADVVADRVLTRQQHAAALAARRTAALAATDDNHDRMAELLAELPDDGVDVEAMLLAFAVTDNDLDEVTQTLAAMKRQNWVSKAGGLPQYIKRIKNHLQEKGMTESHAIAVAKNAAAKMCKEGDTNWPGLQQVNAGSRAEACAAVADWDRKRVQGRGK